ncbi:MAG: DUF4093 domain-containing protein, partial [Oscillospiraceae bacterium]|nr:DUF4093 domain-containing protein [Oscillospiraceae bacterium]
GITNSENITNVYIPDVYGKEKRKTEMSKEGKIGVEGISKDIIVEALRKAGVSCAEKNGVQRRSITKTDFFLDGISGREQSSFLRKELAKSLGLPERISASSLLKIINSYMTYDDYKESIEKIHLTVNVYK